MERAAGTDPTMVAKAALARASATAPSSFFKAAWGGAGICRAVGTDARAGFDTGTDGCEGRSLPFPSFRPNHLFNIVLLSLIARTIEAQSKTRNSIQQVLTSAPNNS
jgi:hypothetical protein